ncbi:hypothetical protein [Clostridium botulinum]|uniref:hypothetical protein n=1 Tax=Clostridium botulinum TaxID=1491 RepID=UPI001A9C23CD|nr:hypothetical protein [Clostridium botulinum]
MYRVSKNFGMNISFDELIKYNKTCKIHLKSTHHFETYEGILIYVSHPQCKEKFSIELGVDEDGIAYEGDYGCEDNFKEILIEEGLKILERYREFINAKLELENILFTNNLSDSYISFEIKE